MKEIGFPTAFIDGGASNPYVADALLYLKEEDIYEDVSCSEGAHSYWHYCVVQGATYCLGKLSSCLSEICSHNLSQSQVL